MRTNGQIVKWQLTCLPDPYVKVYLICDGRRLKKRKTTTKKSTLNPAYNEAIIFDIPPENVEQVSLSIMVMDYDRWVYLYTVYTLHANVNAKSTQMRRPWWTSSVFSIHYVIQDRWNTHLLSRTTRSYTMCIQMCVNVCVLLLTGLDTMRWSVCVAPGQMLRVLDGITGTKCWLTHASPSHTGTLWERYRHLFSSQSQRTHNHRAF